MLSNKNIWTKTKTLEIYCSSSTLNFRFNLVFISYPLQKFNPNFWVPPKIAEMTPWKWIFTSPSSCYPFLPPETLFCPRYWIWYCHAIFGHFGQNKPPSNTHTYQLKLCLSVSLLVSSTERTLQGWKNWMLALFYHTLIAVLYKMK